MGKGWWSGPYAAVVDGCGLGLLLLRNSSILGTAPRLGGLTVVGEAAENGGEESLVLLPLLCRRVFGG